ncbi:MAG TPA: T9SS type A sorting domain-containing protein, partial [Candidatus Krumholzibacterium sp.]|nr:T9SS type A sorting domain-containing protein [Candidatus Krumholzibacterium sp.]
TDFTFDNLGVPKNPANPFYGMDEVYLDDGTPINPLGMDWIDPGLAGFLQTRPDYQHLAAENYGKHKVPSLRNVGKRPSEEFIKAYSHNGFFTSLREIVHFYNTRDVGNWPPPEVPENVNTEELGDLGLSKTEEGLIVTFMETLSDGYVPEMDKLSAAGGLSISMSGPNPFNPSTSVRYYLPAAGDVRLDVYNVAGQRVTTLLNERQEAGHHNAQFSAAGMASGVYFLRLTSGESTVTIKTVMLR